MTAYVGQRTDRDLFVAETSSPVEGPRERSRFDSPTGDSTMISMHPSLPAVHAAASRAAAAAPPHPRLRRPLLGSLAALGLLAPCTATQPEPKLALQSAEQAIATADRSRVADAASPELSEARARLSAARNAVQEKRMVDAERLANESRVDAELASARIQAAKDLAVNDEIRRSNLALAQEMQRHQGGQQ